MARNEGPGREPEPFGCAPLPGASMGVTPLAVLL